MSNLGGPIYQTKPLYTSDGGAGVVPPFFFSRSGNNPTGSYLKTGDVITSNTGQYIPGTNEIVKIVVSCSRAVSANTRVQLQRLYYSAQNHTNKLRFVLRHAAGVQHTLQFTVALYRA